MIRWFLPFAGLGLVACAQPADVPRPRWGFALDGYPITAGQISNVTRETGLTPELVVFFQQWPERPAAGGFPAESLDAIAAAGAEPVLTWEPMFYRQADGAETMIDSEAIVRGDYDPYIDAFARAAATWGRPIIIRFAHEMNISRYHWGSTAEAYGPASPARYQAMWRHVVDRFRAAGASNVLWAFSPNCASVPAAGNAWNTASAYYPGDDYVDILGMDGYNWGNTQTPERNGWRSSWRTFESTFDSLRGELRGLAPAKPLYVFETASASTGGDKRTWLAEMAATSRVWNLDGVVWFEASKEVDWRIGTGVSAADLARLRATLSSANPGR